MGRRKSTNAASASGGGGSEGFGRKAETEDEDQGKERQKLEEEQLEVALRSVLPSFVEGEVEPDDFQDALEHLVSEAQSADLDLSTLSDPAHISELTLDELEAHALSSILFPALTELLGISASLETRSTIVEEVLCEYVRARDEKEEDEGRYRPGKGGLGECELCERVMLLTAHHLIPRSMHATMLKRNLFTLSYMRSHLLWVCRPCHSFIHSHLPSERLATEFNTLEALLQDEGIVRWAKYASKLKEKDPKFSGVGRYDGNVRRLKEQR